MKSRLAGLLVLPLLMIAAPEASAEIKASYATTVLTVNSDEAGDQIVVTCIGNKVLINGADPPAPVGVVNCEGGAKTLGAIVVNGNGGNDLIDISGLAVDKGIGPSSVDGGAGDDRVEAFRDGDVDTMTLIGGPGNDLVVSEGGDFVFGGSGDDRFEGVVPPNGKIEGETGTDTFVLDISGSPPGTLGGVTFAPTDSALALMVDGLTAQTTPWASIEVADLTLTDAPQTADARNFSGQLVVDTRGGADEIYGSEAADLLAAGTGNDFLEGLGGADVYQGGSGFDRIHARDGVADGGDCGTDDDTLVADPVDSLLGCERIELPPSPPPPTVVLVPSGGPGSADTKRPKLSLKRATLGRMLKLAVACPPDELRCSGVVTLAGVGKLGKARRQVPLGTAAFSLASGQTRTLTRTVAAPKRDLLGALAKLQLQVKADVTDAVGNRTRTRSLLPL